MEKVWILRDGVGSKMGLYERVCIYSGIFERDVRLFLFVTLCVCFEVFMIWRGKGTRWKEEGMNRHQGIVTRKGFWERRVMDCLVMGGVIGGDIYEGSCIKKANFLLKFFYFLLGNEKKKIRLDFVVGHMWGE